MLATGDVTGHACLWDVASGELLAELKCGSQVRSIDLSGGVCKGLARTHSGCSVAGLLATGTGGGEAQVWDVATCTKLRSMRCGGMVYSVDLSSDNTLLATGDQHKQALLWDAATGNLLMRLLCSDVVKRVDLSADDTILAVGAGSSCEIWDVPSGTRVNSWPEAGGRIKMTGDATQIACVNSSGQATLRHVLEPNVVSFWLPMVKDADALSYLVECIPSYELIMHAVSPSGRNLLAHASAAGNLALIEKLIKAPTPPAPSSVLQVDCTGRHALDYALKNKNRRLAELLLGHALRMPPHQRLPLVTCGTATDADDEASSERKSRQSSSTDSSRPSSTDAPRRSSAPALLKRQSTVTELVAAHTELMTKQPEAPQPALILMAHMFPAALQRQLDIVGIDTYGVEHMGATKSAAVNRRVREECLTADHGNMALGGHAQPFEEERIWAQLSGSTAALAKLDGGDGGDGARDGARGGSSWLGALFGGAFGCFGAAFELMHDDDGDDDDDEGDTEVQGGVVGIPLIFGAPNTPGYAIWEELVKASENSIDLIQTDAMRAVIGFKWKTYGEALWRRQALLYAFFFLSYVMSCIYLLEDPNRGAKIAGEISWDEPKSPPNPVGFAFFGVTSLINLYYLYLETREMNSLAYFTSAQNIFDLLAISNIFALAPLLALNHPTAPLFGAIGTLLMVPKMASISRGAERYSKLISMLSAIAADMVPFATLMAFIIFANAFAFLLVSDEREEQFSSLSASWYSSYELMLGNIDRETYLAVRAGLPSWVMLSFLYYFTMFVNIVLLNVLISIIGDTYERVQAQSLQVSLLQRANLLLDMEAHMSSKSTTSTTSDGSGGGGGKGGDGKMSPAWVHVLTRVEESGGSGEWAGRLSAIKAMVSDLTEKINVNEESVVKRLTRTMMGELRSAEARIVASLPSDGAVVASPLEAAERTASSEVLRSKAANEQKARTPSPRKSLKTAGLALKLVNSGFGSGKSPNPLAAFGKSPQPPGNVPPPVTLPTTPKTPGALSLAGKFAGGGGGVAADAGATSELQKTLSSVRAEMREQAAQQAAQLAQTTEELKHLAAIVKDAFPAGETPRRGSSSFLGRK